MTRFAHGIDVAHVRAILNHADDPADALVAQLHRAWERGYRAGAEAAEHQRVCPEPTECDTCQALDARRRRWR